MKSVLYLMKALINVCLFLLAASSTANSEMNASSLCMVTINTASNSTCPCSFAGLLASRAVPERVGLWRLMRDAYWSEWKKTWLTRCPSHHGQQNLVALVMQRRISCLRKLLTLVFPSQKLPLVSLVCRTAKHGSACFELASTWIALMRGLQLTAKSFIPGSVFVGSLSKLAAFVVG